MNIRIFCVAVGLMTANTWAQVPLFKMWVTEVYEVNPDGTFTPKCLSCPTQDLNPGIALPGDLINIEVTVEGWDESTDAGECNVDHVVCSVSAQDCPLFHCSGVQSAGLCTEDEDCFDLDTCVKDRCDKSPLAGAFQWTVDSSTYSNGGAGPGLAPAQLPCTSNTDCACGYTQVPPDPPLGFNDCADFATVGFCTCLGATCEDNICTQLAAAYIDFSVIPGYLFSGHLSFQAIDFSSFNYAYGGFSSDVTTGGVPEELFRCNGGAQPICNVDADCTRCDEQPFTAHCSEDADCREGVTCEQLGNCVLTATSPYYLGTLLLEVTGDSCGLFTLDLIQDLIKGVAISTSLTDNNAEKLPNPIVEELFLDLGSPLICDDFNLCTINCERCGEDGECICEPIVCPIGEICVLGNCEDDGGGNCDFDDLREAVWADADPLDAVRFNRPRNCAIDAREPHSISDVDATEGWDKLVLQFTCDPTAFAAGLRPADFPVETDPVEVSPPNVPLGGIEANAIDQSITIHLNRSISPGFYTCISHVGSGSNWCAGYLPADANQNGLSQADDINALIAAINVVPGGQLPIYATDINRSTVRNGEDILRLIDLLNGAGDFDPWITQDLPACPSAR